METGKTAKYFKYAIGEIILVVIGILIALQINNWNQRRIDKKFEITMLKEVKSSLESDLQFYDRVINYSVERIDNGIQELQTMMVSKKLYHDTTLLRPYNEMARGIIFDFNKGGYEGIKSVGLDKITNDSLRTHLILVYEVVLPRIKSFYKTLIDDDSRNKDYKLQLHNALWKRIQIPMPDGSFKIVSATINNDKFLSQPELIDRIKIAQDNLNFIRVRLPEFEFTLKQSLEMINNEINKH